MISILASPKPWQGIAETHQYNAVKSWLALHPEVEVTLYGDAEGTAEICRRLGVQHIAHIDATPEGVPYFGAIADHAAKYARYDLQCYVNCDILSTRSLLDAAQHIPFNQFLMIGQRIDLAEGATIDVLKPAVLDDIRGLAEKGMAQLHPPAGSDYFIFPRGIWTELPKVVIGRGGYDNVLIAFCLKNSIPLIDATLAIIALHPLHDYSHVDGGYNDVFSGDDARINYSYINYLNGISLEDADWRMEGTKLKRNLCRGDWARYCVLKNTIRNRKKRTTLLQICRLIRSVAYKCSLSNPTQPSIDDIISGFVKSA